MRERSSDEIAPETLKGRVRSAVFWRSGSQIVAQLITWSATLIVVRLLDPHDYGLFAMTQVVLVGLNFLNGHSFASSLIQQSEVSREKIAQVFGLLILFNAALATAQFLLAPLAAAYFRQPLVGDMLRAQTLIYAITPFIALPTVLLARELQFKAQAKADLGGAIAGACAALSAAIAGFGVWTLVLTPLVQQLARAIGLAVASGRLPLPRFAFAGMRSVISFGSALILCQFFWVIQSQSDVLIAGRLFDPHDLGLYAEALFLTLIFSAKFVPPLNEVAFPAYTALHRDGGDVGTAFVAAVRLLMFVAMPLYLGLSAVAGPFVDTVMGPKWHEMIPLVAGLPLAMPFFALQIICSPATNALGRPSLYVITSLTGAVLMPVAFYLGSTNGLIGLVHAWQAATPLLLLVTLLLTLPAIKVGWGALARAVAPSAVIAILMAAVVAFVEQRIESLPPPVELLLLVALGATLYLGLMWQFARPTVDALHRFLVRREFAARDSA